MVAAAGLTLAKKVVNMEGLLNVKDVAEYLNVSVSMVRKLRRQGKLPAIMVGGSVRFAPADVEAYIEQRKVRK